MQRFGPTTADFIYTWSRIHSPCKKCFVQACCAKHDECGQWLTYTNRIDITISTLWIIWMLIAISTGFIQLGNYFFFGNDLVKSIVGKIRTGALPLDFFFIVYFLNSFIVCWIRKRKERKGGVVEW